jgi:hypothetical protein
MRLTLPDKRLTGKGAWIAKVRCTDPTYRFNRKFLDGRRGKWDVTYDLDEQYDAGLYEVCVPDLGERYFICVRRGKFDKLSRSEAYAYAKELQLDLE